MEENHPLYITGKVHAVAAITEHEKLTTEKYDNTVESCNTSE